MDSFDVHPGFCPACGTIFPPMPLMGDVICYNCKRQYLPDILGAQEVEFTIYFNPYDPDKVISKKKRGEQEDEADGPIVERKCTKCGYDQMSYATIQLRSADEGQTVFFTCLKCKFKESENS